MEEMAEQWLQPGWLGPKHKTQSINSINYQLAGGNKWLEKEVGNFKQGVKTKYQKIYSPDSKQAAETPWTNKRATRRNRQSENRL